MPKYILGIYPGFELRKFILPFLFISSIGVQAQDTLTIERLDYRFVSYVDGTLVPMTSPEDSDVAGLFIDCTKSRMLEFCGSQSFTIWIDGRYIDSNKKQECLYFSSKELCEYSDHQTSYLSVVSSTGLQSITARSFRLAKNTKDQEKLLVKGDNSNYWILGFLFVCTLIAFIRFAITGRRQNFQKPNLKEYSSRFLTLENFILFGFLAFINAFCYSFLVGNDEIVFILNSLATLLVIGIGKIILTFISGSIFKFWRGINWQLIVQLRYWSAFSLLLFVLLFIDFLFFKGTLLPTQWITNLWSMGLVALLIVIATVLMSQKGLKKLLIFIYLCTTEILPTIILVYWFLE